MKRLWLIALVILCSNARSWSQNDSASIKSVMARQVPDCRSASLNAQQVIQRFELYDLDSMDLLLQEWAGSCTWSEPLDRVRLLMALYTNSYQPSTGQAFVKNQWDRFLNRYVYRESGHPLPELVVQEFLDYIKPGDPLDLWVERQAREVLKQKQPGTEAWFMAKLLTGDLQAVVNLRTDARYMAMETPRKVMKGIFTQYNKAAFYVEGSTWMPVGTAKRHFSPGPYFEFGIDGGFFRIPKFRAGLMVSVNFFVRPDSLRFDIRSGSFNIRPPSAFMAGVYFKYALAEHKRWYWHINGGLGYLGVGTGIQRPDDNPDDDEAPGNYTLSAMVGQAGTEVLYRINPRIALGLRSQYQYSPLNMDRRLKTVVGTDAVRAGLVFRMTME